MKNKKAVEGGMWWIIIGAVVAIAIGFIILFIVRGGLYTGKQNIDLLSSCKNQGGTCKESKDSCGQDETAFFKIGCPDENGDGKISDKEEGKNWCCIKQK